MAKYFGTIIWLALWLLTIVASSYGAIKGCSPVSLEDVRVAARASRQIYLDDISLNKEIPDTLFKVVNIINPPFEGRSLKAVVATFGSTTLICFRGTKGKQQLLQQFGSSLAPKQKLPYSGKSMHVLKFFWLAFQSLSPDTLVPGGIQSGRKYIVTGHSLGGALGSLYSLYLSKKHPDVWKDSQSSLITFGAPRVGDKCYAREHDVLIPKDRKLRFVYRNDVVAHMPLRRWYRHHSREVWIWEKTRLFSTVKKTYWRVCNEGDNPHGCSGDTKYSEHYSHKMHKYLTAILSTPDAYYDRNGNERSSFADSQCR